MSDFVKGQIGKEEARAVFLGPLLVTLVRAILVVGWEQGVKNWELKQWGQEVWTILFKFGGERQWEKGWFLEKQGQGKVVLAQ